MMYDQNVSPVLKWAGGKKQLLGNVINLTLVKRGEIC